MRMNKTITISLPRKLIEVGKARSRKDGRTFSGLVRISVESYLEKWERQKL